MIHTERFAPSPTGPLHLGHAFSAITAHTRARAANGRFLLRIEDIDHTRARPEWEAQILDDLHWLGLTWDGPVLRQSGRMAAYRRALESLRDMGLLFACACNRRDIDAALSATQEGVTYGPDGPVYPGTCRSNTVAPGQDLPSGAALRLDMKKAVQCVEKKAPFATLIQTAGDVVLARKDYPTSYHLSVVVDDAYQGVTHVTRGEDLKEATPIHMLLQNLLDLPTPDYHHHRLIRDETGKRLAKRDDARALAKYRAEGATPADIRRMVGFAGD